MPIVTDDFVYVHMPKTGGMWVSKVLQELRGGEKVKGLLRHAGVDEIEPDIRQHRLVIGTARDPWSWYRSLWMHMQAGQDTKRLRHHLTQGEDTFLAFLRGCTSPSIWMTAPDTSGWWRWPVGGLGLYTETFRSIYGWHGLGADVLIDTAQLRAGLGELLGEDLGSDKKYPRSNPAASWSPRVPGEYDQAGFKLVQEADGELAYKLGFRSADSRMAQPIRWGGLKTTPAGR
jgi:hypothetical protein